MTTHQFANRVDRLAGRMAWFLIGAGIVLRLVLFFQNRNLIIDEANIARNLAERNFSGLLLPLKYEQYAPPAFLWIEKLITLAAGFGEKALRFYSLVCGVAALFAFRAVVKRLLPAKTYWLPLSLMALALPLIRYSTEVKQYMPDVLIALLLVLCALQRDLFAGRKLRFTLFWLLAGSVAIWSSMPSVFTLAAIGMYYMWQCVESRRWGYLPMLLIVGVCWMAEFGAYYWFMLKEQIGSAYLQNYHADYFLYAVPSNGKEWEHNGLRLLELVNNIVGFSTYNSVLGLVLILTGLMALARKSFPLFLLLAMPVILTIAGAALHQFSLIDRVILFTNPFLLIILGYGFNQVWRLRSSAFQVFAVAAVVVMVVVFNGLSILRERLGFHEITGAFDYLMEHHAKGDKVYIHHGSVPTYIYYTELHPDREKYVSLLGAHLMAWESDYAAATKQVTDTVYFVYTAGFSEEEKQKRLGQLSNSLRQVAYFEKYICYVYGYAPLNNR